MLESELAALWEARRLAGTGLLTEEGEALEVVYPGRRNDGRGGDFRDAAIRLDGRLVTGNIEVHLRSSGWQAHGHDTDPSYNDVVLHVVMWHDRERPPPQRNGWAPPTLAVSRWLAPVAEAGRSLLYCRRLDAETAGRALDRLGTARFRARAARLAAELPRAGPAECLYRGLMEALGYARNKAPFAELAHRVPLSALADTAGGTSGGPGASLRLDALLIGAAGLLPSQRGRAAPGDAYAAALEAEWEHLGRFVPPTRGPPWELFRIRPANHPVRRMAALARLVLAHREPGLAETLLRRFADSPAVRVRPEWRRLLTVPSEGYWADHYEPGAPPVSGLPALLGGQRADDIILNILLPLTATTGPPGKAAAVYESYPRSAETGAERQLRGQLGLGRGVVDSARRQQGLLALLKSGCAAGGCDRCPLLDPSAGAPAPSAAASAAVSPGQP